MFTTGKTSGFDLCDTRCAGGRGFVGANMQWWRWQQLHASCSARPSA